MCKPSLKFTRTSQLYPDIKPIYGVTLEAFYDTVDYCINPQQQDLATTTYVFFDLETTGLNAVQDEIIQFGAVVSQGVYDHNPTKISFLIKPKQPLPAFVQKLSGLKESDFTNAPTIEEVFPKIMEIIADHVLVAHNCWFWYGIFTGLSQAVEIQSINKYCHWYFAACPCFNFTK